ncbi:hypothetical protein [Lonepinella sp. BR2904]|uniref:hypothetical protein n=1 Tax=Lonepinella sp. BR2904 TaxID=3434551 RepID=UPI003F6DD785
MLNNLKQWFKTKQQLIHKIKGLEKHCRIVNDSFLDYSELYNNLSKVLEKVKSENINLQAKLHNQQIQHENKVSGLQKVIDNQAKDILALRAKLEKKRQRYFKKGKK